MNTPTVVLVHGAWHGAWCWQRVVPRLQQAGVAVHAVTLTGVADRAHLMAPGIRLSTHVQDVLGLITAFELERVVLVGHSYGGIVITGVAALVYVDAVTPHPGESWSSMHAPETVAQRLTAAQASGGISFGPPDASVFGLSGADRDWVNRRQTPQPLGVYQDRLDFDAARVASLPRTFIDCTSPALPTIAVMRQRVRTEPSWELRELATGHDPMVSEPEALSHMLIDVARRALPPGTA